MQISEHFTLRELTHSDTAIRFGLPNDPTSDPILMRNLGVLADGLERVRRAVGDRPVRVLSGYRAPPVNRAVGGSKTSAHVQGLAADIDVPGMTPAEVARALRAAVATVHYDQVILEYPPEGWVHVSFAEPSRGARREDLTRTAKGYERGLVA